MAKSKKKENRKQIKPISPLKRRFGTETPAAIANVHAWTSLGELSHARCPEPVLDRHAVDEGDDIVAWSARARSPTPEQWIPSR